MTLDTCKANPDMIDSWYGEENQQSHQVMAVYLVQSP